MKLYNKDGKLFDINPDTYVIGRGCFGNVHIIDNNTCVKLYNYPCPANPKLMEEIKNLKLHHFDSLKEILYDENGKLSAYIMPIYRKELPDYFSMKTDEFIKIVKSLYRDILELTDRKICVSDMKPANTMSYRNKIKIVDYDYFKYSKSPKLDYFNNEIFIRLWNQILLIQRNLNGYQDILPYDTITPFFDYSEDDIDIYSKLDILKKYNLVIDCFMENQNGKHI